MSQRNRALLGWLLVAAAALTALGLRSPQPAVAQPEELTATQRDRAASIYASQCATCHGAEGLGGTIPGTDDPVPPLAGTPVVDVPYMDLVMRVGRMPPPRNDPYDNRARVVTISDEDRELIVAYLADEFDLAGVIPSPQEGDAARGREVYATNCAQCHGATGAGGVAGAGAWTPPVAERGAVAIAEAIRVGPFQMPAFAPEQISAQEVADVAAFLEEVTVEPRTPVLGLLELNPVYASAAVALSTLVIVLSLFWIAGRPTWFPDPAGQHRRRSERLKPDPAPAGEQEDEQ